MTRSEARSEAGRTSSASSVYNSGSRPGGSGDSDALQSLNEFPDSNPRTIELRYREYERPLILWASKRVMARCDAASWQAYCRTEVEGQGDSKFARSQGMSVGAVYRARIRILDRIRKKILQAQGDEPFFPGWDRNETSKLS